MKLTLLLLLALAAAAACEAKYEGPPITQAKILERGRFWTGQHHQPYSKKKYAVGPEGRKWRTDCSGLVSMAWNLSTSVTTSSMAGTVCSYLSNPLDAQPGDAMLRAGTHTLIFVEWVVKGQRYRALEQSYSKGSIERPISWKYFKDYQPEKYKVCRYKNMLMDVHQKPQHNEDGTTVTASGSASASSSSASSSSVSSASSSSVSSPSSSVSSPSSSSVSASSLSSVSSPSSSPSSSSSSSSSSAGGSPTAASPSLSTSSSNATGTHVPLVIVTGAPTFGDVHNQLNQPTKTGDARHIAATLANKAVRKVAHDIFECPPYSMPFTGPEVECHKLLQSVDDDTLKKHAHGKIIAGQLAPDSMPNPALGEKRIAAIRALTEVAKQMVDLTAATKQEATLDVSAFRKDLSALVHPGGDKDDPVTIGGAPLQLLDLSRADTTNQCCVRLCLPSVHALSNKVLAAYAYSTGLPMSARKFYCGAKTTQPFSGAAADNQQVRNG
eukprot:TRINITY_DN66541_c1_g1_i1.p1 TRINITY_DN66541_c1_g1~~TRINITY_DN66541_c1_g1_i1.p1  ORF type:complete len:497 (-),score=266.95 TRINITY_DN66541_c1_g1_i1:88-1578(-)